MKWKYIWIVFILGACGYSKRYRPNGGGAADLLLPAKDPPQVAKTTLRLNPEELLLTRENQSAEYNQLLRAGGSENFLELQKLFVFPIQFKGWVSVGTIAEKWDECLNETRGSARFFLVSDFGEREEMNPREKYRVILEKIYAVQIQVPNPGACQGVGVQFVVSFVAE